MRPESRIVGHMRDQTLGGSSFRIAGDELLQIFALEEVESTGPISDDFQIGVIHRQLSKSKNAAAMVDDPLESSGGFSGAG
jgi:hypothetical protein